MKKKDGYAIEYEIQKAPDSDNSVFGSTTNNEQIDSELDTPIPGFDLEINEQVNSETLDDEPKIPNDQKDPKMKWYNSWSNIYSMEANDLLEIDKNKNNKIEEDEVRQYIKTHQKDDNKKDIIKILKQTFGIVDGTAVNGGQTKIGDCGLCATSMINRDKFKKFIKENEDGSVTVTLKGAKL